MSAAHCAVSPMILYNENIMTEKQIFMALRDKELAEGGSTPNWELREIARRKIRISLWKITSPQADNTHSPRKSSHTASISPADYL